MAEDRGIWGTWYDLPEEEEAEYLSWLHGEHIPATLERPGFLWAAHYRLEKGASLSAARSVKTFIDEPGLGKGGEFILVFGAKSAHDFLDPSPDDLLQSYDSRSREMIDLRQGERTAYFTEVGRVDGPEIAKRGPGLTPAPNVQFGAYRAKDPAYDNDFALWYCNDRLAALRDMKGCVGARKLISLGGWARHGILYEFTSLEGHEHFFETLESQAMDTSTSIGEVVRAVDHGPGSPSKARRIWPEV
ncbi:MAG: hypothetical protein HOC91_01060 [Nitrospinaceae bacterium]|jgi:hypothetical protein|nr:hypothetical protein [Nitrospinaceae bacterium]MBT4093349.1 hypothetical protein [Nitrospinaceae bacterium]MBT4429083.1 hypothetical protein [Nitrospinaceae bacterium]MBT6394583.1 hypothetical protein [Nitrospinaceae bacterium]MBT7858450.1 hypothetical protein [Nitrospinaceae bacterium]